MPTFTQITDEIKALHDLLVECGGELTDEQAETAIDTWLAETNATTERKLNGVGWLVREFEAKADARELAAKALTALAGTDRNEVKRIKERVKLFMETCGFTKVETEHFKFTIRANGGFAPVVVPPAWERDPAEAPEAFQRRVLELDRTAIREAIRNDEETHGACLGERGTTLLIK
jgi:Gp157 protein